jgi:hypothetical protein
MRNSRPINIDESLAIYVPKAATNTAIEELKEVQPPSKKQKKKATE